MTMPLIRAHIRNWRRKNDEIDGNVYADVKESFDNGDYVCIQIDRIEEGSSFFIVQSGNDLFRLDKDDERE